MWENTLKKAIRKFSILSISYKAFGTYTRILSKAIVEHNNNISTLCVYFCKRRSKYVIMWNSDFLSTTQQDIQKKYTLSSIESQKAITDFLFLGLWHEVLHITLGHMVLDRDNIIEKALYKKDKEKIKLTYEHLNICADWQINTKMSHQWGNYDLCNYSCSYFKQYCAMYPDSDVCYEANVYQNKAYTVTYFSWVRTFVKLLEKSDGCSLKYLEFDKHCFGEVPEGEKDYQKAIGDIKEAVTQEEIQKHIQQVDNLAGNVSEGSSVHSDTYSEYTTEQEECEKLIIPLMKKVYSYSKRILPISTPHKVDICYSRLGRYWPVRLPNFKVHKVSKDLCIFIDTSCSMRSGTLRHICPIIEKYISDFVNRIRIIHCDTSIKKDCDYTGEDSILPFVGGGGTNFKSSFAKLYEDGVRDILVYTDGYISPEFSIPNDMNVIWILVDREDRNFNFDGHKIYIKGNTE